MKFGLTNQEFHLLEKLLIIPMKNKGVKIWIFGSRARGDYKKFSDIDVLYERSNELVPPSWISQLKENLEESDLPYKVDLVNLEEVADSYRQNIFKDRVELI